jgi:hypothetical protein
LPTWWVNTIVAIFLLPVAGLLTQNTFPSFHRAAAQHAFWATEEFWFFSLGATRLGADLLWEHLGFW